TLQIENTTAAEALDAAVRGTGWLTMVTATGQAMVVRAPDAGAGPPGALTGAVTEAKTGETISGAEVFLEGTRWRTSSDSAGRYRLVDVDTGSYTLIVRRFGYAKQSRRVIVRPTIEDTVDVALDPLAMPLDELVTTATGQ